MSGKNGKTATKEKKQKKAGPGTMPGPKATAKGGNGKARETKAPKRETKKAKRETKQAKAETLAKRLEESEAVKSPREITFQATLDKDYAIRFDKIPMLKMRMIVQGDGAVSALTELLKNLKPQELITVSVAPLQMTTEDAQEQARALLKAEEQKEKAKRAKRAKKGKQVPQPEGHDMAQVPLDEIAPSNQDPVKPLDHSVAEGILGAAQKDEAALTA